MAKSLVMAPVASAPKMAPKAEGAANGVADIKARAAKMRDKGLISPKAHEKLMAKANKVAAALGGETGETPDV